MSGLPQPELHKDAKYVFLSDWDGTITDKDSNDFLTDTYGFGAAQRKAHNQKVLKGDLHFRDSFREMLLSVSDNGHDFESCKELLRQNIGLDPGFETFYSWCKENGIPVIIVSSGMAPIIRAVLEKLVGEAEAAKIEIIANDVKYTDAEGTGKTWEIVWRHPESGFGHDKSQSIIPYRSLENKPTLFFAGDGVSDLSAARHADVLFTKVAEDGASDLLKFCVRENIPHVAVANFSQILEDVQKVVVGGETTAQVIAEANHPTSTSA
ncbi:uncharacterized protein EHS24_007808 [Apiotrichum porosum]|uniref:Phosphoserine phosphatase n=1 Tax=Apiotrichum porosum TaxID=105984 RepID=A0A427XS15_9TREE|nr:uncharacterized protein EHS24_007808 [Apiotrichum porosum]RSH81630.1 hypothetical protein EHS24_007808 [Apiotrichum porosum]